MEFWVKSEDVFVGVVSEARGRWQFECHATGRFDDYYTSFQDALDGLLRHLELNEEPICKCESRELCF